jgi:hypothetical protein
MSWARASFSFTLSGACCVWGGLGWMGLGLGLGLGGEGVGIVVVVLCCVVVGGGGEWFGLDVDLVWLVGWLSWFRSGRCLGYGLTGCWF